MFAAWTTAEHFARWFGGKDVQVPADRLDYEPVVGGTWSATMVLPDGNTIDWTGDFVEIVPDERFVFTMTDRRADPQRLAITVELSPTADGTHMHMTQAAPTFTRQQREATIACGRPSSTSSRRSPRPRRKDHDGGRRGVQSQDIDLPTCATAHTPACRFISSSTHPPRAGQAERVKWSALRQLVQ